MNCSYCNDNADDRPNDHEAVCWTCWTKMYASDTPQDRTALRAQIMHNTNEEPREWLR
jgi:hypothetical protein